jgi:tetratricopeptide (TPR) repeat protein
MLDWHLYGADASGHHLVSLFMHIGAVIFLFLFLNKTTNHIGCSVFVAVFFAIHPLRVESVAWASERKDVLSMFFGMATLYAYAFYAESLKQSKYLLCLILFALALMSKPMMVTLPFVMMLLDYWPLQRWQEKNDKKSHAGDSFKMLFWEKIPFIGLTVTVSMIAFLTQNKEGATALEGNLPFPMRAANALVSYAVDLKKMFWPANLAVFYPYDFSLPVWKIAIATVIITAITFTVIYCIRRFPFLFVGWFWYAGTLIPVIGLVQIGGQSFADRYTYLPSIGLLIMLAWMISAVIKERKMHRIILQPAGIFVLVVMSVLTWKQCLYWNNSIALYNRALQVTENNYLAHNNLGLALHSEGRIEEAMYHYNKSIRIKPDYIFAYINRGNIYNELGRYQLAVNDFDQAIRIKPDFSMAYYNRGLALFNLGQYQQAIHDYTRVIHLQPDHAAAYNNRGNAYLHQGNIKQGCADARRSCSLGICYALELAESKAICR